MKKNILTVVIMAATLINLVLTAVMVFSVVPAMDKTTKLVDKVSSVVDLEIEDPNKEQQDYTIEDLQTYEIKYDATAKIRIQNDEGDDSPHYVMLDGMVVSFNSKAEDFEKINTAVQANNVYIKDIVHETIGQYTKTTMNQSKVKEECIKKIQEKYNTKCIVEISLTGFLLA